MAKDFAAMEDSNRSANPSIHEVSDPARRIVLRGGLGAAFAPLLSPLAAAAGLAGCALPGAAPDAGASRAAPRLRLRAGVGGRRA